MMLINVFIVNLHMKEVSWHCADKLDSIIISHVFIICIYVDDILYLVPIML